MRISRLFLGLPIALIAFAACGDDDSTPNNVTPGVDGGGQQDTGTVTQNDAGSDTGGDTEPAGPFATPSIACADGADSVYGDPGALTAGDANRGKIIKCTAGTNYTKAQVQAELKRTGSPDADAASATSGARVFKVLYQTTRGDTAHSVGYSSALVYMPTVPRAEKLPIIVGARGTRGQAGRCAASKADPALAGINDDALRLGLGLVGYGYAVIVPDLAGYANFGAAGNPPSVFSSAEDTGRSTLDGSRALKNLFTQLDDKTVIVGHSQGGHSAISALAVSATYGQQGTLAAVATYSPLWITQRSWGALNNAGAAAALDKQTTNDGEAASAANVYYHYTQTELLDGPGKGVSIFKPEYQANIKEFMEKACYGEDTLIQPPKGTDFIYKQYTTAFADSTGSAALDSNCKAGDDVCTTWRARYAADRPHLTGAAATTPLFVAYGGMDTTIPPDRARCVIDRLKADNAAMTFCYEPAATHGTIINVEMKYVASWIGSKTLGETAPAACAQNEAAVTTLCNPIPKND